MALEEFLVNKGNNSKKARLVNDKFYLRGKLQEQLLKPNLSDCVDDTDDAISREKKGCQTREIHSRPLLFQHGH